MCDDSARAHVQYAQTLQNPLAISLHWADHAQSWYAHQGRSFRYSWWGSCPTNFPFCPHQSHFCPTNFKWFKRTLVLNTSVVRLKPHQTFCRGLEIIMVITTNMLKQTLSKLVIRYFKFENLFPHQPSWKSSTHAG